MASFMDMPLMRGPSSSQKTVRALSRLSLFTRSGSTKWRNSRSGTPQFISSRVFSELRTFRR